MIIISNSYKKHTYSGDHKGKEKKRCANKSVRMWLKDNPEEIIKGKSFKKIYESYDICDYGSLCSWEEYWEGIIKYYQRMKQYGYDLKEPSKKEEYRNWKKHCKNK